MIDARLVSLVRDPAFWRAAAPGVAIEEERPAGARTVDSAALDRARLQLSEDGYLAFERLVPDAEIAPLRDAVARVVAQGWPPIFVYLYDAPWRLFASLAPVLEMALGPGYRTLSEFWVWHLGATEKARGWPPHRDRATAACIRADGTPETVTIWVSLTDATPENGCIYFVPAPRDPGYRADAYTAKIGHPADIRALPAPAGTVLGWNQYLLHWGGRSSRWATGPRVSVSMTFQRATGPLFAPAIDPVPAFEDRVRLIGEQVREYAHMEPPSPELRGLADAMAGITAPRGEDIRTGEAQGPAR